MDILRLVEYPESQQAGEIRCTSILRTFHGKQHFDFVEISDVEKKMSEVIINQALEKKLNEIWGCETPCIIHILMPALLIMWSYDNNESIIDFKSSNRIKKRMDNRLFFTNMCLCLAHNLQYKTNIRQGVILICTSKFEFQEFIIKDNEFCGIKKSLKIELKSIKI